VRERERERSDVILICIRIVDLRKRKTKVKIEYRKCAYAEKEMPQRRVSEDIDNHPTGVNYAHSGRRQRERERHSMLAHPIPGRGLNRDNNIS